MSEWLNQTTIHWSMTVSEKLADSIDTFSESSRGSRACFVLTLSAWFIHTLSYSTNGWAEISEGALEASQGLWNHWNDCSRSTITLHVVKLSGIFSKAKTKVFRVRTIIWLTFQNLVTTKCDLFVICFHFRYMKNNNLHASWAAFRLKMFHSQKLKGCLSSMP